MSLNSEYYIAEYRKHLKNHVVPNSIWGIILLVLLVLLNLFVILYVLNPLIDNSQYLSGMYSHAIVSNDDYTGYYFDYQYNDLITVSDGTKKRLNVNAYMQNIKESSFLCRLTAELQSNEVAVSKKVADQLEVDVGDSIYLDFALSEHPKEYKVVTILPFFWNYYDTLNNSDFSVVQIGFDEEAVLNNRLLRVYLLNDDEYIRFNDEENAYIRHYNTDQELLEINNRILIVLGIGVIISVIISFGLLLKISRCIKNEAVKYFRNGFPIKTVISIHAFDYLLLFIIPQLLFAIVIVITSIISYRFILWYLTIVMINTILLIIVYIREIGIYGKTD